MPARFNKNNIVCGLIDHRLNDLELPILFLGRVTKIDQQVDYQRCVKSYKYTVKHKSGKKRIFWEQDLYPKEEVKNCLISLMSEMLNDYLEE